MPLQPPQRDDFERQRDAFIDGLTASLHAHRHVRAAWLEGSLGRGTADRYSDLDLHVLVEEDALPAFPDGAEGWLSALRPLVLFNALFGGAMLNALTLDGLRIDVWPHGGAQAQVEVGHVRVLTERPGALIRVTPAAPPPAVQAPQVLAQTREFWRCVALLPSVIGREERIVAVQGLAVEVGLVTELLIAGSGRPRDRGVKHLNAFLDVEAHQAIEAALALPDLSTQTVVDAHLRLVALVRRHGPRIADTVGYAYPTALEQAVLAYVLGELRALGVEVTVATAD